MTSTGPWVCTVACVATLGAATARQTGSSRQTGLDDLLEAVGRYVREYERSFSAVVSREHYVQRARSGGTEEARELRSEVALVAVGNSSWLVFRDVHEVDGRAVRDRDDRLAELFMKPTADIGAQARRIAEESARHNLGNITRTGLNTPTQALEFVRLQNQTRSAFRLGGRRTTGGVETQELRFEETGMPRMVVTRDDAAASGRMWVVPATGTVVRTEVRLRSENASATIAVSYARQDKLSLWVPVQMVETYEMQGPSAMITGDLDRGTGLRAPTRVVIEGRASYTDFRRFSVNTTEIIR